MPLPVTESPVADTRYVVGDYDSVVNPTVFASKEAAGEYIAELHVRYPWLAVIAVPFAAFDAPTAPDIKEGK